MNPLPVKVTELRRQVEEQNARLSQVQQALDDLRRIHNSLPVLVATADRNGYYKEVNAAFEQVLGWSEQESLSRPFMEFIHPDDRPVAVETFEFLKSGETVTDFVDRNICKDGSYRWISWTVIPIPDRGIVFGIGQDISARRQAEMALERAKEELEIRVKDRTQALERQRQTLLHMLQASDHERQLISYDIHDGLAQLLSAAIMQLQIHEYLRDHEAGKAETAYDAGVELLKQAHSEARRLISGVRPPVLDEAGVAVAISHLVHEAKRPKGPQIVYYDNVEFDRLPPILENAVYRIAQEAVTNACQYSESEKVKVSLVQEGEDLCLEVRDWGVGFDPESVDQGRFGLEGMRERARLLGGNLAVESEPGKGTCIRVTLPILKTS